MSEFEEITDKIKILKKSRDILQKEYEKTDFHQKKESHPHETVPPLPEDEEIYKLLTAIQQIDNYIKKYQDDQYKILKNEEE